MASEEDVMKCWNENNEVGFMEAFYELKNQARLPLIVKLTKALRDLKRSDPSYVVKERMLFEAKSTSLHA